MIKQHHENQSAEHTFHGNRADCRPAWTTQARRITTLGLFLLPLLGLTSGCVSQNPKDDKHTRWVRPAVEVYRTPTGQAQHFASPPSLQGPMDAAPLEGHIDKLNQFLTDWQKSRGDRLWLNYHPQARQTVSHIVNWLAERGHAPMLREDPLLPAGSLHLEVVRYQTRLPECGHWKNAGDANFENRPWPGFGCSNTRNLGMMVADPADLAAPAGTGFGNGLEAAMAVDRKRSAHDAPAAGSSPVTIMTGGSN